MNTIDLAHNDYPQYLAELGAPASLAALLFMLGVFRRAVRPGMDEPSNDRRYVALACAGWFTAIMLHSFVDFNLYIPADVHLWDGIAFPWQPAVCYPAPRLRCQRRLRRPGRGAFESRPARRLRALSAGVRACGSIGWSLTAAAASVRSRQ
ncbi:MAG: hypothetical protein WBL65_00280 [Bryobacteraceae bacterium]